MAQQRIAPATCLRGTVVLPADKSISHRAALFAGLADGVTIISGYSSAADPQSTLSCLRALGIEVTISDDSVTISGKGKFGLEPPTEPLDCGNSGTTMRLLAGILAGQSFPSTLTGDESLSSRPMKRIADPLTLMGASVELTNGTAPIKIEGRYPLKSTIYPLPVPSAQVKSCVLLAGMYAEGRTEVHEFEVSRDHTERMLGLEVSESENERRIAITANTLVRPGTYSIPRDFSAAAFFLVAGSIVPGSELVMKQVGINPTRTALLTVLQLMGADIQIENEQISGGEPIADVTVRSARLTGVSVPGHLIANMIDELPVLAIAGAVANGTTEIRGAGELRHKETDRIAAMSTNMRLAGVSFTELDDGWLISGNGTLRGARFASYHDHRIAMAMAVAGLMAEGESVIEGAECAAISFPGFWKELESIRV